MDKGHIYLITGPTGKQYIGQTVCIRSGKIKHGYLQRWKEHVKNSQKDKNGCFYLENAIKKYGEKEFKIELIEEVDINKMNEKECYYIEKYNTIAPNGYNLMTGGSIGRLHNEKTKDKISQSCKGNEYTYSKNTEKRSRKRSEDENLPLYIRSYTGKREKGYSVYHPLLKHKRFASLKKTLEENLELALEYLKTAPKIIPKPHTFEKREDLPDSKTLPKYISIRRTKYDGIEKFGYGVRSHGNFKGKVFMSSKLSMEEKFQLALNYLNSHL